MSNILTVYFNSELLMVRPSVLEQMGLSPNQCITEAQMWQCIELNAIALVTEINQDNPEIDTSALEATLAEIASSR